MKNINVTKSYLPPIEEYVKKISLIWENHFLTNYGPLNNEFVEKLKSYLKLKNIHYVTNGTISLQLSLEALDIQEGEIITTPFTFIATSSSIMWQRCKPVFVDIETNYFNIDVNKIEEKITENTKAIMAVHCFGFPCDVKKIEEIAKKHNLYVIYDAAHAFGAKLDGKSLLSYGDIASCSLHATKIFHSVEGGLCVVNNERFNNKMEAIKNFGKSEDTYSYVGINAKNSEFHAAMGLCVFEHFEEILSTRKHNYEKYTTLLEKTNLYIPKIKDNVEYNYIYYPVVFETEEQLLRIFNSLNEEGIYPRRYFYPSLNELKIFANSDKYVNSEDISKRIACLPLDTYLSDEEIEKICDIIIKNI